LCQYSLKVVAVKVIANRAVIVIANVVKQSI